VVLPSLVELLIFVNFYFLESVGQGCTAKSQTATGLKSNHALLISLFLALSLEKEGLGFFLQ